MSLPSPLFGERMMGMTTDGDLALLLLCRYNKYTSIAAQAVRRSLKEEHRVAADRRGLTAMRYQHWENGKGGEQVCCVFAFFCLVPGSLLPTSSSCLYFFTLFTPNTNMHLPTPPCLGITEPGGGEGPSEGERSRLSRDGNCRASAFTKTPVLACHLSPISHRVRNLE